MTENSTIGWREWLALPDLGIPRIKAKVDTGARSSSIHAFDVEVLRVHGRDRVRFKVKPSQKDDTKAARCDVPLHDMRWVKSSTPTCSLRGKPTRMQEVTPANRCRCFSRSRCGSASPPPPASSR